MKEESRECCEIGAVSYGTRRWTLAAATFALGLAAGAVLGSSTLGRPGAAAAAQTGPGSSGEEARALRAGLPAQVLRVLDGDTFEARVNVWPGMDITTK